MTIEHLEVIEEAAHRSALSRTRGLTANKRTTYEDLKSEAWAECLAAAPRFDPAVGPAEHYFNHVAYLATLPKQQRISIVQGEFPDVLDHNWFHPDDGVRPSSWFARAKSALLECLDTDDDKLFAEMRYGLGDGPELKPREAATALGTNVLGIYKQGRRLEQRWQRRQLSLSNLMEEAKEYPHVYETT